MGVSCNSMSKSKKSASCDAINCIIGSLLIVLLFILLFLILSCAVNFLRTPRRQCNIDSKFPFIQQKTKISF